MLYTAKGTASLLVPMASVVAVATGGWSAVLVIAGIFNIVAAVMALLVLRPLRVREINRDTTPSMTANPAPAI
jgi:OFA family oxalate/formate antiporter-like MFS transporter